MPKPADQNCSICKYFVASANPLKGYCARNPPAGPIIDSAFISPMLSITGRPGVSNLDWCGEYKT